MGATRRLTWLIVLLPVVLGVMTVYQQPLLAVLPSSVAAHGVEFADATAQLCSWAVQQASQRWTQIARLALQQKDAKPASPDGPLAPASQVRLLSVAACCHACSTHCSESGPANHCCCYC